MLTNQEKDRIRAEMQYRELLMRELHPPTTRLAKFWKECSHPAVITILGGLIVTVAAAWFQHRMAVQQQTIAHKRHMKEVKLVALETFCKEFERDMTVLYGMRRMQLQLRSEEPDAYGRSKAEVTKSYLELSTYYYHNCHPIALLQKTTTLFESQAVHEKAKLLHPPVMGLLETELPGRRLTTDEINVHLGKLKQWGTESVTGMYALVDAMAHEFKRADLE